MDNISVTGVSKGSFNYLIYHTGSQYEALNGETGLVHKTKSPSDAASVINAVINDLTFGGIIKLAGGTIFLTRTKINVKTKIHIQGAGESTIIKQDSFQNLDAVIESDSFTTIANLLFGAGGNCGPHSVYLSDFVIEGNKSNNTSASTDGIRYYGYNWHFSRIHIRNCSGRGMYSEWADDPSAPNFTTSMESTYNDIRIHDCDGDGWLNRGPHDWKGMDIDIYDNGGHGYVQEYSAGFFDGGGFVNKLHCYANDGLYGLWIRGGSLQGSEITGETCANSAAGVNGIGINVNGGYLLANDVRAFNQDKGIVFTSGSPSQVIESEVFSNKILGVEILMNDIVFDGDVHDNNNAGNTTGKGIKIGASDCPVVMCTITGTVKNHKTANFDWANSENSALNVVALCYTDSTYPTVLTGSPNMRTNGIQIINHASATVKDNRFRPINYDQVQKSLFDRIYGQIITGQEGASIAPVGIGLLASAQLTAPDGTISHGFDSWEGRYTDFQTSIMTNTRAGLGGNTSGNITIVDRRQNPRFKVRCKVTTSTGTRLYVGFSSATVLPASDTPLANGDSGVLMGWDSKDTQVSYWANDGSSGITNAAIGAACSVDANWKVFEFQFDDTNGVVLISYNDGTLVSLNSNIPAQDTQLCVYAHVQCTASSAARTFRIGQILLEKDFIP